MGIIPYLREEKKGELNMKKSDSGVKNPKNRKKKAKSRLGKAFLLLLTICLLGCLFLVGWQKIGLPCLEMYVDAVKTVEECTEDTFRASQTSLVYDASGAELLSLKGEKDVYYLEYEDIPDAAKLAMISVEDKKFIYHRGYDIEGIARAAISILKNKGEVTQGGSTITQQLSRNVFLSHKVSWERKVEEIFIAVQLEKKFSKEDIMEFYLNNIYFSNGYYGIQAASQGYFGKDADELSLSQIAFLCAVPNGPTYYDPINNKENTLERRDWILKHMREDGIISDEQYENALAEEITVIEKKKKTTHDYVDTYVLKCAAEALMKKDGFEFKNTFATDEEEAAYQEEYNTLYDSYLQSLYTGGYRIYTSINMEMQEQLQNAVNSKLSGFTATKEDGSYVVQGSATCIDNRTGRVVAIVGGRKQEDGGTYTLNRAYQAYRQPGSAIKPFLVFAPMLERGMNAYSTVDDSKLEGGEVSNSGGKYLGKITLRKAVQKSSNVVTYRLYEELTPEVSLEYLEEMNFKGLEPEDYQYMTTCLGGFTRGTNTLEMAAAYATLENGGVYRNPTCIVKIESAGGDIVVSDEISEKRIYQEEAAVKMTDILQSVVDSAPGTARGCKLYNQPAGAKTGTTTGNTDGWLCGYTPYYTTAVWVGQDQVKTVSGLSGQTYPAYIWKSFMSEVHEELPRQEFPEMDDVKKDPYHNPTTEATTTATTAATTTEAPAATTEAPATTTEAPATTTEAPVTTTEEPTTTTEAPATTTEEPATATEAPDDPGTGAEAAQAEEN